MTRSCLALGVLLVAAGCVGVSGGFSSGRGGTTLPHATAPGSAAAHAGVEAELAPSVAASPAVDPCSDRYTGFYSRMTRGIGYYWLGITPTNIPMGDLTDESRFSGYYLHPGSGDGVSFGVGLKFTESARAFFEIAIEKMYNHDLPVTDVNAYHDRFLVGGRTAAAPRARMERQPRPYLSYGVGSNSFAVDELYEASSFGPYLGLGVELPFAESSSFAFDAKYHYWSTTDSMGKEGVFSALAISLFWLGRF